MNSPALADWLPSAAVGITFTVIGLLKIYGLSRGIVGGGCKPASQRLCGSCPSWSRSVNIVFTLVFLGIGIFHLVNLARLFF